MMMDDGGLGTGRRYRIGKISGIPIYITLWLIILAGYSLLKTLVYDGHPADLIWFALLVVIIVIHELGHAMTARRYGNKILGITLHLFGGVMEHRGELTRRQSIIVSLAGPAVHLVLIPVALVLDHFFTAGAGFVLRTAIRALLYVNVILLVFNLLPIFPLDGGQVARQLLTKHFGPVHGIVVASTVAVVVVVAMGLLDFLLLHRLGSLGLILVLMLGIVNVQELRRYRDVERTMGIKPPPFGARVRQALRNLKWRFSRNDDVGPLIKRAEQLGFDSLEAYEQQALERRKLKLQTAVTLRGLDSLTPKEQLQLHELHFVIDQGALRN